MLKQRLQLCIVLLCAVLFTACTQQLKDTSALPAPLESPIVKTPLPTAEPTPLPTIEPVKTLPLPTREPKMPGGLPRVYPQDIDLNKAFFSAFLLPDVRLNTDNKTNAPIAGKVVSIPSGRFAFAFLPTRPREEKSIQIDKSTLNKIAKELKRAKDLKYVSKVDWAKADFKDYWLTLYVLTDDNVYNRVSLWGPILYEKHAYVDVMVQSLGEEFAFESWRIDSPELGQLLMEIWGPKFDLNRFNDVVRIDMSVKEFHNAAANGLTAVLEGDAARKTAQRMLQTSRVENGYGKCSYNIELCFTFTDGSSVIGWLNGDSCPGIAMDNGPSILFDKEITRELYDLLGYGEGFIAD